MVIRRRTLNNEKPLAQGKISMTPTTKRFHDQSSSDLDLGEKAKINKSYTLTCIVDRNPLNHIMATNHSRGCLGIMKRIRFTFGRIRNNKSGNTRKTPPTSYMIRPHP